jgi:hypothetical protein
MQIRHFLFAIAAIIAVSGTAKAECNDKYVITNDGTVLPLNYKWSWSDMDCIPCAVGCGHSLDQVAKNAIRDHQGINWAATRSSVGSSASNALKGIAEKLV